VCGIVAYVTGEGLSDERLRDACLHATDTLRHRGPDDSGTWTDSASGVALGHRRLAILDLSQEGRQPMVSDCGRYVIVFNGEVYNFQAIRKELESAGEAPAFRGSSDTEVMLAAISAWGLERAVGRFIGMFAFALWDRRERVLSLARDRIGKKPLYYARIGSAFACASELHTFSSLPGFAPRVDRNALRLFVRHNYIPAPHSILEDVRKLEPGTILAVGVGSSGVSEPRVTRYWSAEEVWREGGERPFASTEAEAETELEELLRDSVHLRMVADVPLGAFLSGGIDSSLVVALMQSLSPIPVRTFTIGFHEATHDEARYAREVARHLGTDHTELYVSPTEAREIIPDLATIYREPFADSSQIPTCLVARLARKSVTVALSGDGGDELFNGYPHHVIADWAWRMSRRVPKGVRRLGRTAIGRGCKYLANMAVPVVGILFGPAAPKKAEYGLQLLSQDDFPQFYRGVVSHTLEPERLVIRGKEPPTPFDAVTFPADGTDTFREAGLLDILTYLPEDILTKVDRASMAVGLEARTPLLDHRVVEFAARVPTSMKIRNGQGKLPLRRLLNRYVPPELVDRPKMGFAVPLGEWLKGPLRGWAEDVLAEDRIRNDGYFHARTVRGIWREHLTGQRIRTDLLWCVLMFQEWLHGKGIS